MTDQEHEIDVWEREVKRCEDFCHLSHQTPSGGKLCREEMEDYIARIHESMSVALTRLGYARRRLAEAEREEPTKGVSSPE